MDEWVMDRWRWMSGWMVGWMDEWVMGGWIDDWLGDRWVDGWMETRTPKIKSSFLEASKV